MSREKGRRLGDMGEIIITSRSKNSSSCMGEVASSLAFVLGRKREREREQTETLTTGVRT